MSAVPNSPRAYSYGGGLARLRQLLKLLPKPMSNRQWLDLLVFPPVQFVSGRVVLRMVNGAKGDGKFVAHFKSESFGLSEPDVVSVGGRPPANKARLACDVAQMLFRADSLWLAEGEYALVDLLFSWTLISSGGCGRLRWLSMRLRAILKMDDESFCQIGVNLLDASI